MTARRLLLISVVRPTLEYGSEVWEGIKAQAAALESVMIGGAKRILGCSSRTCVMNSTKVQNPRQNS